MSKKVSGRAMANSRRHILLMEDNQDVQHAFCALFESVYDYALHAVSERKEAQGLLGRQKVDIAIVDLAYGVETSARMNLIRTWRREGEDFPIIVTSANDYDGLCVAALSAGADDFVRKPFAFDEMSARIRRAIIRGRSQPLRRPRVDGVLLPASAFEFAGAQIHPDQTATFPDGSAVQLTTKQLGILQECAKHRGGMLDREQLIHAVWGADANPNSKSLDQYLYLLRKIYRDAGIDLYEFITPSPRVGWRIAARC
jgi:DNA-binding response OmpR family regulator